MRSELWEDCLLLGLAPGVGGGGVWFGYPVQFKKIRRTSDMRKLSDNQRIQNGVEKRKY